MNYPKRCCICGGIIGQTLHACCQFEWSKQKRDGNRIGRYVTYQDECHDFSIWYVEDYEKREVANRL